jgi:hypothetical protein
VAYGMMSFYAADRIPGWGTPDRADRQFSPTFVFNQANAFRLGRSRATDCTRAGTFVGDAMAFVQETGCALMSEMPHVNDGNCWSQPSKEAALAAAQYRVGYYVRVDHDVESAKVYLLEDTPLVIVAMVGDPFIALSGATVYSTHNPDLGSGHCMLVIGYDDNRRAIRLFNSWGTSWGDGGYAWISYDIWETFVAEAWVAQPVFAGAGEDLTADLATANPYVDSDGDGIPDSVELFLSDRDYEYDPQVADPDGPQNIYARPDSDLDGWADETELRFGTDPDSFDEYPFMPGYAYPDGFFDQFDGSEGVLESTTDLEGTDADDTDQTPPDDEPEPEPDPDPGPDDDPGDDSGLDSDNDGVPDSRDLCPDTLPGFIVDEDGCPFAF